MSDQVDLLEEINATLKQLLEEKKDRDGYAQVLLKSGNGGVSLKWWEGDEAFTEFYKMPLSLKTTKEECEEYQELLWNVLTVLGHIGSKHDRYALSIQVEDRGNENV